MVTRDRAENRDGPKVSGGRRGSRDPWPGQGTVSLRAGPQGAIRTGDPRSPELGRKLRSLEEGARVRQDPRGRQKHRAGGWVTGVGGLRSRGRGRGLVLA